MSTRGHGFKCIMSDSGGEPSLLKWKKWKTGRAEALQKVSCTMPSEGLAEALEERLDEGNCSWWGLRSRTDVLHNLQRRAVCRSAHFRNCQVSLKLWHATWEPTGKTTATKKKKKTFQIGKCFLGWLNGFPTQATNEQFMHFSKTKSGMAECSFPLQGLTSYHPSFSLSPQTPACQSSQSYLFRRQYFSSLWASKLSS